MVDLSDKHPHSRLRHTVIAEDDESEGEVLQHPSADVQSSQAVTVCSRETSLVRYEDIIPRVETLSARVMVCQYLTLGMTVMLCVYLSLLASQASHEKSSSLTLSEASRERSPQGADVMRRGAMQEVPAAKVTGSSGEGSDSLSSGKDVQRPKRSADALQRHDGIKKPRSRGRRRQRVRGGPATATPSSSQSSRTVLFPGAAIHKDSQGRVDYWLVRREDGQETRMVPVDVTKLGVVFRAMDSGQEYLVTYEGEWTRFRPN